MWRKTAHCWKIFHTHQDYHVLLSSFIYFFYMGASHHKILWQKQLTEKKWQKTLHTHMSPSGTLKLANKQLCWGHGYKTQKTNMSPVNICYKTGMWEKVESEELWEDRRMAHQFVKDQQHQVLVTSGEQEAFQIPVMYHWNWEKEVAGSSKARVLLSEGLIML